MSSTVSTPTLALTLPPVPASAQRARRALVEHGLDPDLDHAVSLLTTELVSNCVRHAADAGDIHLAATLAPGFARVEVLDAGRGFDPEAGEAQLGLGLRLVGKLSTRWGAERARGMLVWFEVDRRRRRFSR